MRALKPHALLHCYCSLLFCLLQGCAKEAPEKAISVHTDRARVPVEDLRPFVNLGGLFSPVDQEGKAALLEAHQQSDTLLFFGYTYCPDFCPTTLSRLVRVKEQLDAGADTADDYRICSRRAARNNTHRSTIHCYSQLMSTV